MPLHVKASSSSKLPISRESEILMEKLIELENACQEFQASVDELIEDSEDPILLKKMATQLCGNADQMLEDAKRHQAFAESSRNPIDYRFAMGWVEGSIEWLSKPLLPLES